MENTETFPSTEEIEAARERAAAERAARGIQSRVTSEPLMDTPFRDTEMYPTPADEPEFSEEPSGQVHLVVEGAHEKLGLNVTGRTPTSSTLAITGGKVEVAGQYDLGDTVSFVVTVVVGHVGFKDETDAQTRQVVGRERQHKARIVQIQEQ